MNARVCRALLAILLLAGGPAAAQERFDILMRGGRVYDGTGNPWFQADIGIRGDRIVAVGRLDGATAGRVIDAQGKAVVPGFIDLHSHADDGARSAGGLRDTSARRRAAPNLVTQGITTVVVNQDGRSPWPLSQQRADLERGKIGPNTILLVGHGSVRQRAMGEDVRRPATPAEVARIRELVRQGMMEGAWGLSAGLEYVPGRWSTTDEVVAAAEEIVPFGGVYISHERSEGADPMWYWPSQDPPGPPTLIDAVSETIEIGERTGATVVASHIKAKGAHYWGASATVIRLIEEARARGVNVWADQYPYETTGSDGGTVLIPDWAFQRASGGDGGRGGTIDYAAVLRKALADSGTARKIRTDIAHEIRRRGGADRVLVLAYRDSALAGKYLSDVAAAWRLTPVEAAIQLQLRGDANREGGVQLRGLSLSAYDLEPYAAQPWVATATDGGIALPEDGFTHPRFYGTFPRKIRHLALDRGVLSVENAIRSATSLPARILGLRERGMVHEGYHADIAVIDLGRIRDRSTFFEPHVYADGVDYVLVNGQFVVEQGQPTWALPGRVLTKRPGGRTTTDGEGERGGGRATAGDGGATGPIDSARMLVQAFIRDAKPAGLSVAVGVDGQVVWSEGFGYADLEQAVPVTSQTRFRIGSISKSFTAAAIGLLYQQGRLDLDAEVQRYVPSFPRKRYRVTVRQLAGHVAGIRHYRGAEMLLNRPYRTVTEALEIFDDDSLLFEPGTKYSYSSYGWTVLSAVVEATARESFLPYMQREVFRAAGMTRTAPDRSDSIIPGRTRFYTTTDDGRLQNAPAVDNSYKWAGGGFLSTPEDLLAFAYALLDGRLLSPETVTLLWTSQRLRSGEETGYGIGWRSNRDARGHWVVSHTGGSVGGTSVLAIHPEARVVLAMTVNLSEAQFGETPRSVAEMFVAEGSKE